MIAPTTEAIDADAQITSMGNHSLKLWPQWLAELPVPVFYRDTGTLLFWYREHAAEASHARRMLTSQHLQSGVECLEGRQVAELEPEIGTRFPQALYFHGESQIDNRGFLKAVSLALEETGVECHWETRTEDRNFPEGGIVVDCRGMGAKGDFGDLRGVRGEIVRLHAPDIELDHMLRLLHPRHPVYIVPRPDRNLIVGATSIESEDRSAASVRGVLELLTSAYSILPALAEARILEFNTQVRPALPDNLPALRFDHNRRILCINGLYRHGFLLTPAVVEEVLGLLLGQSSGRWPCLDVNYSGVLFGSVNHSRDMHTCLSS
jgi:glycine oxidase